MKFINCCMIHYAWLICKPFTTTMSQQQSTDTGKNEGKNLTLRKSMSDRTCRAAAFLTGLLLKATPIRFSSSTCSTSHHVRDPTILCFLPFPLCPCWHILGGGNSRSCRAVTAAASAGRNSKGATTAAAERNVRARVSDAEHGGERG